MKRKPRHVAPRARAVAAWAVLLALSAGIVALTTTEGVIADSYVVKLYRFLGDERRSRVALSRLLNGLTVSAPHRPHLDLLYTELRDGDDSRWLFDKATRVLLRLGQMSDARRFMERWLNFDRGAPAITRAIEIDVADGKRGAALGRCSTLAEELRADVALALTCADVARAENQADLARDFTRRVRDNALSNPKKLLVAHVTACDADEALAENRADIAREQISRGLRAVGPFDPATLSLELRPIVVRLLTTESTLGHLAAGQKAKRLLLAAAVVEKAPENAGLTREFLDGVLTRHAAVYQAIAKSAPDLVKASPEFAEWWSRTGLSSQSADGTLLLQQRVETLALTRGAPRPFNIQFSMTDWFDRLHNIGLFVPFGLLFFAVLRLSTALGRLSSALVTLFAATSLATLLEFAQYFWIPRRHADVNDVWTATVGALLGIVVAIASSLVARLFRGIEKPNARKPKTS